MGKRFGKRYLAGGKKREGGIELENIAKGFGGVVW